MTGRTAAVAIAGGQCHNLRHVRIVGRGQGSRPDPLYCRTLLHQADGWSWRRCGEGGTPARGRPDSWAGAFRFAPERFPRILRRRTRRGQRLAPIPQCRKAQSRPGPQDRGRSTGGAGSRWQSGHPGGELRARHDGPSRTRLRGLEAFEYRTGDYVHQQLRPDWAIPRLARRRGKPLRHGRTDEHHRGA